MYLIDRFSHLLGCEVALHFVNTWDINVLTFDYHWKQLQLPVWIDYQALYLQHFMPIDYKSHIELFRNWSFHEFYHLKALMTSKQVITSVVEKKTNLYQQNFEVYTWKPGSRIGDWELGLGIRDQWFLRREEKSGFYYNYIKNLTQTIISFISLTTFPLFLNPFMFYLLLWPLHFHSFWWVFVLLQL